MVRFPIEQRAQRVVLAAAIICSVLSFVFVCLRLLAHQRAQKAWTVSDYMIVAAAILAIGLQGISIAGVAHTSIGWGHVIDVITACGPAPITLLSKVSLAASPKDRNDFYSTVRAQILLTLQFFWILGLSLSMLSILLLYIRIFLVSCVLGSLHRASPCPLTTSPST